MTSQQDKPVSKFSVTDSLVLSSIQLHRTPTRQDKTVLSQTVLSCRCSRCELAIQPAEARHRGVIANIVARMFVAGCAHRCSFIVTLGRGLQTGIFEFFRLKMASSSAFLMHNAGNSSILRQQTEQNCWVF